MNLIVNIFSLLGMALVILLIASEMKRRREEQLVQLQREITAKDEQIRNLRTENAKLKDLVTIFLTEFERRK